MTKTAVMWVALGTPDAPTPRAVRRYLREFLTDRRIVEMNPVAWRAILELFILPHRARASAEKYASVWYREPGLDDHSPSALDPNALDPGDPDVIPPDSEVVAPDFDIVAPDTRDPDTNSPDTKPRHAPGSPLLVHTRAQVDALRDRLAADGVDVRVAFAMRYGQPSVGQVLDGLYADGVRRVLIAPAYPQYSQTTVGSVYDAVAHHMTAHRDQMELRFIRSFPQHPLYIEALAKRIEHTWAQESRPDFAAGDVLLLSYHGIPVSMARGGDPYPEECAATTHALRARLGLDENACRMTFQSKFGPAEWLTPATIDTVAELGRAGVRRVDVACPAFAADCLETLEEIGLLNRETYLDASGHRGAFVRVPCLNDDPAFIDALADVVSTGLGGWA